VGGDEGTAGAARQYQAVTLTYWGGKTLAETGMEMGVSLQRVAQILDEAKKTFKMLLKTAILKRLP